MGIKNESPRNLSRNPSDEMKLETITFSELTSLGENGHPKNKAEN